MKIKVPKDIKHLSNIFCTKTPLYIVGGFVRNSLMRKKTSDIDLTSSLTPKQVIQLLKNTDYEVEVKNQSLGSLSIISRKKRYDYTTFREDMYACDGSHMPSAVTFTTSIVDDSARRDFTINTLYYSIDKDLLIDFYGGVKDIKSKTLRAVGEADKLFKEDAERMLRLIRFATQFDFSIEEKTLYALENNISLIKNLNQQRVQKEFIKILFLTKNSKRYNGLRVFDKYNLWGCLSDNPIFSRLQGLSQRLNFYYKSKETDVLLAFCLDIYTYLKDVEEKELVNAIFGKKGINCPSSTKEYIYKNLRSYRLLKNGKRPLIPTKDTAYLYKKIDKPLYKEAKRWTAQQLL